MSDRLDALGERIGATPLARHTESITGLCRQRFEAGVHGHWPEWSAAIDALPALDGDRRLDRDAVTVRSAIPASKRRLIESQLQRLSPWRKGPFDLHGVYVDSEWRSNLKWNRVSGAVDVSGARVLDVGSGNGYFGWRMVGAGARSVVGVDPTLLYFAQFLAVERLLGVTANLVLPLPLEDLPGGAGGFDLVFSMGVLYHQRSPVEHLRSLRGLLRPGGTLVLETLVVDGDDRHVLVPEDRYAKMRNVWFLPAVPLLVRWLKRCGFVRIEVHDVATTTVEEQRATDWMRFESLADFLDPDNPARTIEGYPAPVRAILLARRPA